MIKKGRDKLNNRSTMLKLLDITTLLTKTGKLFKGNNEKLECNNSGLFLEIASLFKKYNPIFQKHLEEGPKNAIYISNLIENGLISSIYSLHNKLFSSLKNKKILVITNETSDSSYHELMLIFIRYFDDLIRLVYV